MLCGDLSRFKEDPTLLLGFILHMSDEWQAIRFCLLFSETRSGVFPADRRKPNEFFAELINWHSEGCFFSVCHVYRHMLVPMQVYMSVLYLYIYIACFGMHVHPCSRLLSGEQLPSPRLLELCRAHWLKTRFFITESESHVDFCPFWGSRGLLCLLSTKF